MKIKLANRAPLESRTNLLSHTRPPMLKMLYSPPSTRSLSFMRSLCLLMTTAFAFIFAALAKTVWVQATFPWDQPMIQAVIQFRRPWLNFVMNTITDTGGNIAVVVMIGVALYFFWHQQRLKAITLVASFAGAILFNILLKLLFGPPQPILLSSILVETRHSFPSGHAVAATVLYGFFAVLLWRQHHYTWAGLASAWIIIVAVSRVYVGAHFPSEVFAGLALGGLWLFATFTLFDWYAQRT